MTMIELAGGAVDLVTGSFAGPSGEATLTRTEVAVVDALWKASPAAVSVKDLLKTVWGYSPKSRTRTVSVTIQRLRTKIEQDPSRPASLVTRRGSGYALVAVQRRHPEPAAPIVAPRESVHAAIHSAFAATSRVALVGPAGIGKSHIARDWDCSALWVALDCGDDPFLAVRRAMDLDGAQIEQEALEQRIAAVPSLVLDGIDALDEQDMGAVRDLLTSARGRVLLTSEFPPNLEGFTRILVPELDTARARDLLDERRRLTGLPPLADDEATAVLRVVGGVPLWIGLAATVAELLVEDPGMVQDLGDGTVRGGVLLERCVSTGGPEAERLLVACAAFAGPADPRVLQGVSGMPRADYLLALQALRERGVVTLGPGGIEMLSTLRSYLRNDRRHALDLESCRVALREWLIAAPCSAPVLRRQRADLCEVMEGSSGEQRLGLIFRRVETRFQFGPQAGLLRDLERWARPLRRDWGAHIDVFVAFVEAFQEGSRKITVDLDALVAKFGPEAPVWRARALQAWCTQRYMEGGVAPPEVSDELLQLAERSPLSDRIDFVIEAAKHRSAAGPEAVGELLERAMDLAGETFPQRQLLAHLHHLFKVDASRSRREAFAGLLEELGDVLSWQEIAENTIFLGLVELDEGDLTGADRVERAAGLLMEARPRRASAFHLYLALRLIELDPERSRRLCVGSERSPELHAFTLALLDGSLEKVGAIGDPALVEVGRVYLGGGDIETGRLPVTRRALRTARRLGGQQG